MNQQTNVLATPVVQKGVVFNVGELSEAYALRTLAEYIREHAVPLDIAFTHIERDSVQAQQLDGFRVKESCDGITDVYAGMFSDYSQDVNGLNIDASLLKNCAKPLSEERRLEIRNRLGMPKQGPV